MASPLPLRPSIDHTPRSESAIVLGEDDTTDVLESLASETARDLLSALADEPATASELADAVGTSLQNAHYHLTNLREAGLVTAAGTWYSSKGKEMTVYAVTSERLELQIGSAERTGRAETDRRSSSDSSSRPLVTGN